MSTEFGNIGEHDQDPFAEGIMRGSVYFGPHPDQPVVLGMGSAEDDRGTQFLRIGNVFGRSTIGR